MCGVLVALIGKNSAALCHLQLENALLNRLPTQGKAPLVQLSLFR